MDEFQYQELMVLTILFLTFLPILVVIGVPGVVVAVLGLAAFVVLAGVWMGLAGLFNIREWRSHPRAMLMVLLMFAGVVAVIVFGIFIGGDPPPEPWPWR